MKLRYPHLELISTHCERNLDSRYPICKTLQMNAHCPSWHYGLWSFQMEGTKLERFLPKNQHTQRKLLNFENWVNGEVSKFDQNLTKI